MVQQTIWFSKPPNPNQSCHGFHLWNRIYYLGYCAITSNLCSSPGIHLPDESGEAEAVGQRRLAQREVEAEAEMNATLLANSETAAHRQHPNAPSGMAPTGKR